MTFLCLSKLHGLPVPKMWYHTIYPKQPKLKNEVEISHPRKKKATSPKTVSIIYHPPNGLKMTLLIFYCLIYSIEPKVTILSLGFVNKSMLKKITVHDYSRRLSNIYATFFNKDLIFALFNIRSNHWVLTVIVKQMTLLLFDIECEACILYIAPQHPHLSPTNIAFPKK